MSVEEDVEKWNSCALLVELQIGAATMKNIMEVPKKKLPYDQAFYFWIFTPQNLKH